MASSSPSHPPIRQPLRSHFRAGKATRHHMQSADRKDEVKGRKSKIDARPPAHSSEDSEILRKSVDPTDAQSGEQVSNISVPRPRTPPPRPHPNCSPDMRNPSTRSPPRTPPRTPVRRCRNATLPDIDLFEPLHRSPVSVRTDPDTGKMYLMLPGSSHIPSKESASGSFDDGSGPMMKRRRATSIEKSSTTFTLGQAERQSERAKRKTADAQGVSHWNQEPNVNLFPRVKERQKRRRISSQMDASQNPFLGDEYQAELKHSETFRQANPSQSQYIVPSLRPDLTRVDGSHTLPLPSLHNALLALHSAVEHALVVHIASMGTAGSSIEQAGQHTGVLAIPELVTFSTLRPLVERSSGRRFSHEELARLLWIWSAAPAEDHPNTSTNLGFSITRTRTLDKVGRRIWDYALGIQIRSTECDPDLDDASSDSEAELRRIETGLAPRTPSSSASVRALGIAEPQSPSPSPCFAQRSQNTLEISPSSPSKLRQVRRHARMPSTSSEIGSQLSTSQSPSSIYSRQGISLVALWNNGMERRKRIFRRRLLRWCLDCLSTWRHSKPRDDHASSTKPQRAETCEIESTLPSTTVTPKKASQNALNGNGGLLTPSTSRPNDWIPNQNRFKDHFDLEKAGPSSLLQCSFSSHYVLDWDEDFPLERVAPTPMAILPDLDPEDTSSPATPTHDVAASATISATSRLHAARQAHKEVIAQSEQAIGRKLTLAERIRAKEEAAKARRLGTASTSICGSDSPSVTPKANLGPVSAQQLAASARKRAAISRLQDVAESIYMLFVASTSGGGQPSSYGSSKELSMMRFSPLPLQDVTRAICNASRTAMSASDAETSLHELQRICPGLLEIDRVGIRYWIKFLGQVQDPDSETLKAMDVADRNALPGATGVLNSVRRCVRAEMRRFDL